MAISIYDLVKSDNITAYWETVTEGRPPYFFESRFPAEKKLGLDLSYLKGSSGLPIALNVSAFDAQAVPRNRIGFDKMNAEMPFFKESLTIDEKLRQELNMVLQTGNQAYIDAVMNRIFDDEVQLLEGAAVTRERMRASAVTTGYVTLVGNGQEYSYDYGIPSTHKLTKPEFNNADTDISKIINDGLDIIEGDTGVRPTIGIMTRAQMSKIQQNKFMAKNIYVLTNGVGTINESTVLDYLEQQTGVRFTVYSKKYKGSDGKTYQYLADDTISIFPDGVLGKTWFGTTPEESDLMSGATASSVSITDIGVAVTTMKRDDPVNVETKVSMINLPSLEAADQILNIDVSTD